MKLNQALLFSLIISSIFLALYNLESGLSLNSNANVEKLARAFQTVDKLQVEANYNFQVHRQFNRLQQLISKDIDKVFAAGPELDFLRQNLPPHDITLARTDNNGETIRIADLNGGLDHEFIKVFVKLCILHLQSIEKDIFFRDEYREEVEKTDKKLRKLLGNQADSIAVMQLRAARLAMFASENGLTGLFWDNQTLENGDKAFFFARINLEKIDSWMPYREAVKSFTDEETGCLFFDIRKGDFLLEGVPEETQKRPILKHLKSYLNRSYLKKQSGKSESFYTTFPSGRELAVIGREMTEKKLIPVVVIDYNSGRAPRIARAENLFVFVLICAGFWIFIQTIVFERGIRLNVGKTLIVTSLLAICMPFMMGGSIFRLILAEAKENERLKLERELHNTLTGLDSGVRIFHANLFQNFVQILNREDNIKKLLIAQKHQKELSDKGLLVPGPDPTIAAETVKRISKESFRPFESFINTAQDNKKRVNAIIVLGSNGFMRFLDRFGYDVVGHVMGSSADSMYLTLNLYRKTIEPFFSAAEMAPGLKSDSNAPGKELEKFMYDELKARLVATLGADKFLEIFTKYEGLNALRTSIGISHFSVFPLRWNGIIQFFCGIGWDEFTISDLYMKTFFANLYKKVAPDKKNIHDSIFRLIDPAFYFEKKPIFIQGFCAMRGETITSSKTDSSALSSLIKESFRSKRPVRAVSEDNSTLYQVTPGKYFALYTTGGSLDTWHLGQIEKWRSWLFVAGLVLFMLFAVFAAVNISRSFTGPLQHLLWGIERIEKSDFNVRLKDSREDEFGSISRAFNFMARRLREKDTLGKFVSESVRKLARDPELLKKAQQGSEEEITVVFADLEGFVEFAAGADALEVQAKLEFCLEAFFKMAEEFGGEIDKVIGEKLLIIFPHNRVGKRTATVSAVKLISSIIELFNHEKNLRPVFGVNCGKVISGIIGTSNVRMDNTVIGDPVNVAARLCSLAKSDLMPVVVSGEIREILGDGYRAEPVEINRVRGKQQEVEVFSLEV